MFLFLNSWIEKKETRQRVGRHWKRFLRVSIEATLASSLTQEIKRQRRERQRQRGRDTERETQRDRQIAGTLRKCKSITRQWSGDRLGKGAVWTWDWIKIIDEYTTDQRRRCRRHGVSDLHSPAAGAEMCLEHSATPFWLSRDSTCWRRHQLK